MTSTDEEQLASDERLARELQQEEEREAKKECDEKKRKMDINKDLKKGGKKLPRSSRNVIFLRCKIGDAQSNIPIMIDTGASHSFLSKQMVYQLKLQDNLDRSAPGGPVRSFSPGTTVIGALKNVKCGLTGRIDGQNEPITKTFNHYFNVLQQGLHRLIIGMDVLDKFKCVIDIPKEQVTFNESLEGLIVPFLTEDQVQELTKK